MELGLGPFVDVAVGVLSILVIFSLAATAIQQAIAELIRLRPRTLEHAVATLLDSREDGAEKIPVEEFYRRPEIRALMRGERKPSAIPARVYAETVLAMLGQRRHLLDEALAAAQAREDAARARLKALSEALGTPSHDLDAAAKAVGEAVRDRVTAAAASFEAQVTRLEREWNDTMDRVSGWYARKAQGWLFGIGLVLAAGANVNLPDYMLQTFARQELQARAVAYAQALTVDERLLAAERPGGGPTPAGAGEATGTEATEAEGEAAPAQTVGEIDENVRRDLAMLAADLEQFGVMAGWRCGAAPVDATGPALSRGWAALWNEGLSPYFCAGSGEGGTPPDGAAAPVAAAEARYLPAPGLSAILGWVLIAFGTTLGAQFWYELLKQALALRTSGRLTQPPKDEGAAA